MSDTTIQEFSSCLFEVSDKLSDIEYKNLYELLGKINTEREEVENMSEAGNSYRQENMNLYRQNTALQLCYKTCRERERDLKQTNRRLQTENKRLKNFINNMTCKIFTKNVNGIGDKMRRKLYDIFNDTSEEVRNNTDTSGSFNYKHYITYELNSDNNRNWYNEKNGKLYFAEK